MIEHFVAQGQQVFAISWRNPEQEQGHFDLDTYAEAVAEARDAVASIAAADQVHLAAACSGGIITAGLARRACRRPARLDGVASLTLMVCALDNDTEGTMSALASRDVAAAAVAESARKGYLDGQALAGVFTWLRPNDLVWNYVVNNYLLGKAPPAFDILYWNQDTVRLAAGLHRDFIHIGLDNLFARARRARGARAGASTSAGRDRHVLHRRSQRPHRPVGGRLPQRQAVRGPPAVCALEQRSHPGARQPTGARTAARASAWPTSCPRPTTSSSRRRRRLPGSWWPDWDAWLAERSGAAEGGAEERSATASTRRRERRRGRMSSPTDARRVRASSRRCRRTPGGETTCARPAGSWSCTGCSSIRSSTAAGVPRGDGRPVVLMPGFGRRRPDAARAGRVAAADRLSARTCGFVANVGCSDRAVERVERRRRTSSCGSTDGAWR